MNLITVNNPAHLTAMIKSLASGSFERKYHDLTSDQIVAGYAFATQGLSQEQLNTGLQTILEMGFCPDAALFRRWCLGQKSFENTDAIADSYIGKHAALHRLEKWLANKNEPISVAIKMAYDATYQAWRDIHSTSDRTKAELAFKDEYQAIVNQFVRDGIACQEYQAPIAIESQASQQTHTRASDEFVDGIFEKLKGKRNETQTRI